MAGTLHQLNQSAQTVTTTVALTSAPPGGRSSASFLWDISAITGTWAVALYLDIGGNSIKIAELTGRTTTGLVRIPLTADFSADQMAIPNPTSIIYTEAVAGSLTSAVYAVYGEA
jgi:hypothetical protein